MRHWRLSFTISAVIVCLVFIGLAGCGADDGLNHTPPAPSLKIVSPLADSVVTAQVAVPQDFEEQEEELPPALIEVLVEADQLSPGAPVELVVTDEEGNEFLPLTAPVGDDGTVEFLSVPVCEGTVTVVVSGALGPAAEPVTASVTFRVEVEIVREDPVIPDPPLVFVQPAHGTTLTGVDDQDGDLRNGFQIDVILRTDDQVEPGSEVILYLDGVKVAAGVVEAVSEGADEPANGEEGRVVFPSVELPETGKAPLELSARVTDDPQVEAVALVAVDTGRCQVRLWPATVGECDFGPDDDMSPGTEGVTRFFRIDSDCSDIALLVNGEEVARGKTNPQGQVMFQGVTILDGVGTIQAKGENPGDGRFGQSLAQPYESISIPPLITYDHLSMDPLRPTMFTGMDDLLPGEPGLQIRVSGVISGLAEGVEPGAKLMKEQGVIEEPVLRLTQAGSGAGRWLFVIESLNLPEPGEYTLEVTGSDRCGNGARGGVVHLIADTGQPVLRITDPLDGAILNLDGELASAYGGDHLLTVFQVEVVDVPPEGQIFVECRQMGGQAAQWLDVNTGVVTVPGGGTARLEVEVLLGEGPQYCRAAHRGANRAVSDQITLVVASGEPFIWFTDLDDGQYLSSPTVEVVLATVNVDDGTPVTLLVNGVSLPLGSGGLVVDGGVVIPGVPLERGPNVLEAHVLNNLGEPAQPAIITVILDDAPPLVTIESPWDGQYLTSDDDGDGDLTNGFQISVSALVVDDSGGGAEVEACLYVDDYLWNCKGVSPGGGVIFPGVILPEGPITLRVEATDRAGNTGSGLSNVIVDTGALNLQILSPREGQCFLGQAPAPGAAPKVAVEILVQSGGEPDSEVFLNVNNRVGGVGRVSDDGYAVINREFFLGSHDIAVFSPDSTGRVGFSRHVNFQVLDGSVEPGLAIVMPVVDGWLNSRVPDSSGKPGFQTDVLVMGVGVNDHTPVVLEVLCSDGRPGIHQSPMVGGEARFQSVTLVEGECTVVAAVNDCADRLAQSTEVFTVDRTPPQVSILSHQTGDVISGHQDVAPEQEGIQVPVMVQVNGGASGTPVVVKAGDGPEVTLFATRTNSTVTFPSITFRGGRNVPLTVVAFDQAGNEARDRVFVDVLDGLPGLQWVIPSQDGCMVDASSVPGFQGNFEFAALELDEGLTVRLCSDGAGSTGTSLCLGRPGFHVVGERFVAGGKVIFRDVPLSDGDHRIYGEVVEGNQVIAQSVELQVVAISTLPTVTGLRVLEDVGGMPGVLNLAKDGDRDAPGFQGTVEVTVSLSQAHLAGENRVTIYSDSPYPGTVLGQDWVTGGDRVVVPVSLAEGTHNLTAAVQGYCSSEPSRSSSHQYLVDVTPPVISFQQPVQGQLLLSSDDQEPVAPGLQYTVVGVTDGELGQVATLTVEAGTGGAGGEYQTQVGAGGLVTFPEVNLGLEGSCILTLAVADQAGNPAVPASVEVTVAAVPPEINIMAPVTGTVLTPGDDLDPGTPGVQVEFQVAFEGAAPVSRIQLHSSLVGEVCSVSAGAQGVVTLLCTITKGEHQFTATVEDQYGNEGRSAPVAVSLQVAGCGLYFIRPQAGPAHLSGADDKDHDNSNGLQYDLVVGILDPACVGVPIELHKDGTLVSTVVAGPDLAATFADQRFDHGEDVLMVARMDDGTGVVSEDSRRITVTLLPPQVSYLAPPDGVMVLNRADDMDSGAAGLQYTFEFKVAGPEIGGGSLRLESDRDGPIGETSTVHGDRVMTLSAVTLSEGTHLLTVTVSDVSGDSVSLERELLVDVTPPDLPILEAVLVDRRRPEVMLSWVGVGDDGSGGGPVAAYDLRYSQEPIDEVNFDDACMVDQDVNPGAPGAIHEVVMVGPRAGACRFLVEGTYYFAMRAIDRAGNLSPVMAVAEEIDVGLKIIPIPTHGIPSMGLTVQGVGDLNGDGFNDVVVTSRHMDQRKVVIMYGAHEPDQMVTQILEFDDTIFGYWVADGFLDLNGDGVGDLVVASMTKAYVYFGQDGGQLQSEPSVEISLPSSDAGPLQVGRAGNFTGAMRGEHGLDSLLISSPFYGDRLGGAWIVAGRASWPTSIELSMDGAENMAIGAVRLEPSPGATGPQRFGSEMAVIGDMDGDGMDEVVIGAMEAGSNKGQAYVFYGRDISSVSLLTPDSPNVLTLERADGGQYFGATVVGGFKDLDGDGIPDFGVVSQNSSRLTIYRGGPIHQVEELHHFEDGGTRFFGSPTGLMGDFDGNGMGDVVISSNYPSPYANKLWFYFNDGEGFGEADPVYHYGVDGFGSRLAPAGDVNGDGYPDLVVGSNGDGAFLIY